MNNIMLQRLFWKEYRTQRGFWLGIAGMGLVLQLIVLLVADEPDIRIELLFSIPVTLPVFYALGSTAMTFASEKEDRTWERLRILATSPGRLFLAKFGFSVASTLLMVAVLVLLSCGMAGGRIPDIHWKMEEFPAWILMAGEFLLWGTFLSLLTRRVLSAVCLIPLCAFTFTALASFDYTDSWVIQLVLMGFLLLANIGLSRRWLKRENLGWPVPWSLSLRRKRTDYFAAMETASPQKRLFKCLKWQERQQARQVFFVFLVMGVSLVMVSFFMNMALNLDSASLVISQVSLLCGVWVFRGEQQEKRFRYLTECGVTPHTVWLSKQRVWITAALVLVFLFLLTDLIASSFHPNYNQTDVLSLYQGALNKITEVNGSRYVLPVFLLYCFATYCIGQFVSMLFSRAVTAAFLGFMFSGVFLGWLLLMLWLNVPLLFSVWPIPLVLLWATRVRCTDWMLEREGLKPWLKTGSLLFASVIFVTAGVAYHRVTEIEVSPALANDGIVPILKRTVKYPIIEERKTAEMYRRAMERITNPSKDIIQQWSSRIRWDQTTPETRSRLKSWLRSNEDVLQLTLEASRRGACSFFDPTRPEDEADFFIEDFERLSLLLLTSARKLESEDKLDEAWMRYLASLRLGRYLAGPTTNIILWKYVLNIQNQTLSRLDLWMVHPSQTKERLVNALKEIRLETDNYPSPVGPLKNQFSQLRNTFLDRERWYDHISHSFEKYDQEKILAMICFRRCFPWEQARTLRLLDEQAHRQLNRFLEMEQVINRRGMDLSQWAYPIIFPDNDLQPIRNLQRTTPLFSTLERDYSGWLMGTIDAKTKREATLLRLALVAYRNEHGELPQRLDQLVGEYFDELPLDPWSGREFGYRPKGFPTAVQFSNRLDAGQYSNSIAKPGQPLFWSAGPFGATVIRDGETEDGLPVYRVVRREGLEQSQHPSGRAFVIPE